MNTTTHLLIKHIKMDLENQGVDLKNLDLENKFYIHFGICGYIRNQYLYPNKDRSAELMSYFNLDNVDSVSHRILNEILKLD